MDNEQGGGNNNNKISGIKQIAKLKELLNKWHNITISPANREHYERIGISPIVSKRLKESSSNTAGDSDEEGCPSPEPPPDVPKGFLAVYVGQDLPRRRFVIPTIYLSHHVFKVLLEKAEEEFGFDHGGGLTIPCDIEIFKYLIGCIENENQAKREHADDAGGESSSTKE